MKVDLDSKKIMAYGVPNAAVQDSQEFVELVNEKDKEIHADSAYVGKDLLKEIHTKNPDVQLQINEKAI